MSNENKEIKEFTVSFISEKARLSWVVEAEDIAEAKKLAEKMMVKMEGKDWEKDYKDTYTIYQKIP